jgi:hypothetical protein
MSSLLRLGPRTVVATLGLLALVACQQLVNDLGGGSVATDGGTNTLGSVCVGAGTGADGIECCTATNDACTYDYECCAGECNGGVCASTGSTFTAELGSRCTSVATCACTNNASGTTNCFQGLCGPSVVTTTGSRCCLDTGIPCGADGDCCSDQCDSTASTCD